MNRPSLLLVVSILLAGPGHALLARHNEQGLSPTHSYKRTGSSGVVSNLNGNLVVSSTPVAKPGAPLGVSVSRTWNSHWRDPLFTFQYDMDYSGMDFSNPDKRRPAFDDRDITGTQDLDIGGFAVRRFQRYDTPARVPSTWAFAQSVSMSLITAAVQGQINSILQQKYGPVILKERTLGVGALNESEKELFRQSQELQAASEIFGAGVYLANGGLDDLQTLKECAGSAAGGKGASSDCVDATLNVANAMFGSADWANVAVGNSYNIPLIQVAQMGYNVAKGDMTAEDLAWQVGGMVAQQMAASIAGGGLAGGVAGVAAVAAVQAARMYIMLQMQWATSFDVGIVSIRPWALGVNGYLGMLGTNHEPDLQRGQSRFHRVWRTHEVVQDTVVVHDSARGVDSSYMVDRLVWTSHEESRHPIPDLQLVGSDGGASRFILSDDSSRLVDGRRWVSYVSLSNADQRKVYFCLPESRGERDSLPDDPTPEQIDASRQADTSGFYLVKESDGTQLLFGMGANDKGITYDHAGFHSYWTVLSRVAHPAGDTVNIARNADHSLRAAWDVRTGRGAVVEGGRIIDGILSQAGALVRGVDTTWVGTSAHHYETYTDKYRPHIGDVAVVSWEARRVSDSQIDTTRYQYQNGDLAGIQYANGSATVYGYTSNRADHRDGFVLSEKELGDAANPNFYRQRIYDYGGWDEPRPQALKTAVTTILRHPDYVVNGANPWRESQQTDWYYFAPMVEGMNVNRALAGYQGRTTVIREDGTMHDTDKVVDSLEYRTTRFQLVAEYHGAGSPGMVRKQYIHDGDNLRAQIESRGLGGTFDPRITTWEYDEQGSRVRERLCPQDLQQAVKDGVSRIPGASTVSFRSECPEVETRLGVAHREAGEFWLIERDTLRVPDATQGGMLKAVVDVARPNPTFRPDSLYQLGLPTSSRRWRTNADNSSTLVADSTEWEDWHVASGSTALTRVIRTRVYDPGKVSGDDWPVVSTVSYADDLVKPRPTLPTKSWRSLGGDSASLTETEYDNVFVMYPVKTRSYVQAARLGQAGSGPFLETSRVMDLDRGWVLSETAPGGRTTSTTYDRLGRVLTKTSPDGGVVRTSYVDRLQNLSYWRTQASVPGYQNNYPSQRTVAVQETDAGGVTSEARFDGVGRLVAVRRLAANAPLDTKDTALQQTTLVSYNAFDKLGWKRDADGRQEFHDYDGTGRLTSSKVYLQSDAASALSLAWENRYEWHDAERTMTEIDPLGTRTTFRWDGLGRDTLIERDADLLDIQPTGDASAGLNSSGGATKIQVRQRFDNLGNVLQVIDPKGLVEKRRYDVRNRITETIYPDDLRHAVGYDLAGRAVRDTVQGMRSGAVMTDSVVAKLIVYDGLDRALAETFLAGGTGNAVSGFGSREDVRFHWDSHGSTNDPGQLIAVERGTGVTTSYTYDRNGRPTNREVVAPQIGYSVGMTTAWNTSGLPVNQSLPGSVGWSWSYDTYQRATGQRLGLGADSVGLWSGATFRRNDLGMSYTQGNRLKTSYTYEDLRPLLTENLTTSRAPAQGLRDTLYLQRLAWDAAGNVAGMRRGLGDSVGFQHDRLGQLRVTGRKDGFDTLSYDLNGNRIRQRYTMDGGIADSFRLEGNRNTASTSARKGTTVYRFDLRGNQVLEADFANASDTSNVLKAWRVVERRFNRRDELERVIVRNRLGGDSTAWSYAYDEAGSRIQKRFAMLPISGVDTSWNFERQYAYDGVNMVADSGRGDSSWSWWGFQGYKRLAWVDRVGSDRLRVRYLLTDHLGTVNAVVDDTGAVLSRYVLDPWGNVETAWETLPLRYRFAGKEHDPEVGGNITYVNSRFLDNERGVWTERDPKEELFSPFSFVANSPIDAADYTGQTTEINRSGVVTSVRQDASTNILLDEGRTCREIPIGRTLFWNEFINPGSNLPEGRLMIDYSWESTISDYNQLAVRALDLPRMAEASKNGGWLDIKTNRTLAPYGPMTGKLFEGNYMTARSAGNFLAGYNGKTGRYAGVIGIPGGKETYMKLAGALQQKEYSVKNAIKIVMLGRQFGPAPYYGEMEYSGRMISLGWDWGGRK